MRSRGYAAIEPVTGSSSAMGSTATLGRSAPRYQHVGSNPYDAPDADATLLVGGDL